VTTSSSAGAGTDPPRSRHAPQPSRPPAGPAGREDRGTRGEVESAPEELAAAARAAALRLLALAPRTRAQLERALLRKGIPEPIAAEVLDRFQEVDLVDDEQFARAWVTSRHAGRGLSRRALASELRRRGVADDLVRDAVEGIDEEQELRAARTLVRRRLPGTAGDDGARRIRRLARMLARKGYDSGVALRAVREELAEEGQDLSEICRARSTCEFDLP